MPEFLDEVVEHEGLVLRRVREGRTEVYVPDPQTYKKSRDEYWTSLPAFYNPLAEITRDVSVLAVRAYADLTGAEVVYVEALAGTGIRGFRVLNESGIREIRVLLNDVDAVAVKVMKFNWERVFERDPRVEIRQEEANVLLTKIRDEGLGASVIEIDPFGPPTPFAFNAVRALRRGGLLLVTATDVSCLVGKYPEAAMRKYGAYVTRCPFANEVAARVLTYMLGVEASRISRVVRPLFAQVTKHYVRVVARLERGKQRANAFWREEVGWISFCPVCGRFELTRGLTSFPPRRCDADGVDMTVIGPLYVGELFDKEFCQRMLDLLPEMGFSRQNQRALERALRWSLEAPDIPLYYNVVELARQLSVSPPSPDDVVRLLREQGYRACRTHFDPVGVKTDAPAYVVREVVQCASRV